MKTDGEKIAALTCYDAAFAAVLAEAGVDVHLVGDSLGMVLHGRSHTLAVTVDDVAYHVRCVDAGSPNGFIVADMPFGSFQESPQKAFANAVRLAAAGAKMVKIEGGSAMAETTEFLASRGIPVCSHLGLQPQSINLVGGYKVQGRDEDSARRLLADAKTLESAGAQMLVLELMPATLAADITRAIKIPTIGIGAGPHCDGQVLVLHDMLGMSKPKRFTRNFLAGGNSIQGAIAEYVRAVKSGEFPSAENSF